MVPHRPACAARTARRAILASSLVASLALLATSAPAATAPKRITGKLNKPGYTVIALAANGKAKIAQAKNGTFKLTPPATRVTLHLRASDGTYAGPIVVARDGKRAIVGVRAGAGLGEVKVSASRGYAKASKTPPEKSLDRARTARAKNGVPIGAGVFGRVRSKSPFSLVPGDSDVDGVPNQLDIDDNGNLILDDFERSAAVTAAQAPVPPPVAGIISSLHLALEQTANANGGSTDAQIDAAGFDGGRLMFSVPDGSEVDCGGSANPSPPPPWLGGLEYCTRGGTGRATSSGMPDFPECCDLDGDGLGTVPPGVGDIPQTLIHGAAAARVDSDGDRLPGGIGTGDVLIVHVPTGGDASECPPPAPQTSSDSCTSYPVTLQYVFATVPALVSYHDTAGNSGAITYPRPAGSPPELPVAAGPDGQVRVTLTLWRPQRRPIPGEPGFEVPGAWTDIGGLTYGVALEGSGGPCQESAYSEDDPTTPDTVEDDPNLTVPTDAVTDEGRGFRDSRQPPDQPASAANKLTFTVNLSQCTASPPPWNPGDTRRIRLNATPPQNPSSGTRGKGLQLVQFKHK